MATATPATPGLRGKRDQYLALLLSDVQSQAAPPQPQGAPPVWTPGGKFPFPTPSPAPPPTQPTWNSPVTPAPTDADVRLAELTAGLVAAGDNEHRQAEAIRRLTGQLQLSEKRVRRLERRSYDGVAHSNNSDGETAVPQTHSHRRKRASHPSGRTPARDLDNEPVNASSSRRRESSRLRPATSFHTSSAARKQTVPSTSFHTSSAARKQTVPSTARPSDSARSRRTRHASALEESSHVGDDSDEVTRLRNEKLTWQRECERYEKESTVLSKMFADFKKDMQRLVNERSDHLKVIARLQDQLATRVEKRDSSPVSERRASSNYSPPPHRNNKDRRDSPNRSPVQQPRYPSPHAHISPHELPPAPSPLQNAYSTTGAVDETVTSSSGEGFQFMPMGSVEHVEHVQSERELELREELRLVLEENARLSSQIPALTTESSQLGSRLRQTEEELRRRNETSPVECNSQDQEALAKGFNRVVEEVDILEGVSDAIHFGTGPNTMGHDQSLTQISLGSSENTSHARAAPGGVVSKREERNGFMDLADRVSRIRSSLSVKYGQWLEVIDNQTTARYSRRSAQSSRSSRSSRSSSYTPELTVESMNSKVIDKLIADS